MFRLRRVRWLLLVGAFQGMGVLVGVSRLFEKNSRMNAFLQYKSLGGSVLSTQVKLTTTFSCRTLKYTPQQLADAFFSFAFVCVCLVAHDGWDGSFGSVRCGKT